MDVEEGRWVPPRPSRVDVRGAAVDGPGHPAVPSSASSGPLPGDRGLESRRADGRRSPLRRVGLLYLGLLALTALVAGAGAAAQPVYGSLAPAGGTTVADVRDRPTPTGWTRALVPLFGEGIPASCFSFRDETIDARHVVVTATVPPPSSTAENQECQVSGARTAGIVVALDPESGAVLWRRDLELDLGTTVSSLIAHAAPSAGAVVIGIDGSGGDTLIALSAANGDTISQGSIDRIDEVINFAVSGSLVLSVVPDSGGTVQTYSLRRLDSLDTLRWRRAMSTAIYPEFLSDRVVVPLVSGTIQVSGETGRETPWGTDIRRVQSVRPVDDDQLLTVTYPRGVGLSSTMTLLDRDGRALWSQPIPQLAALVPSRTCIVASTGAASLTCFDRSTGRSRWTAPISGDVIGTPPGSTTDDIQVIGPVGGTDSTLTIREVDAGSGRIRFTTTMPRGSAVVGQGTTTGYGLDTTGGDGRSRATAFDLDDGRTLWTIAAADVRLWGGRLVEISSSGVAGELVGTTRPPRHGMLDG
ncbi:Outer membrane protein assembly factor BamB [Frondihabitans sp. 762G35]|uniref:outer membrane protein assembly factor BamB family protein n=1 Tax=Frondihabitans sp. 762G35 TaxID=1446794 RepID=UPI000D22B96A|nr:PQQ-binding-like beta-propeller repeat protein [Frondihabitans sp. 762G35]ARC57241.1 Outer membrane protein assembly factor BamB [Frondihabitans sp. 762G35]